MDYVKPRKNEAVALWDCWLVSPQLKTKCNKHKNHKADVEFYSLLHLNQNDYQ